jgi:alkanesulfonate monooxygenase SsuD/methylene tetrahydromethanopterin reductase-like flavin-dependent oxidoreductase (luciferase family)
MSVEIGVFVVPDAEAADATVEQVVLADQVGLDVVGVQDHPYQRRFLDTWTLLPYLAARTERVKLVPDVSNLPLRQPAVLAKAAASLDVLSGGRVELGLGAGAFWDRIDAMGGPRRSPGESVEALEEAIAVVRAFWSGEESVTFEGRHYRLAGATPGPPPAHRIGIWLGVYGPRMLRLAGRAADGWLPSLSYLGIENADARQQALDEAARRANRDPSEIRRALNVTLEGDPDRWVDTLVSLASEHRFETLIASAEGDPRDLIRRLGEDVAPRVREALG